MGSALNDGTAIEHHDLVRVYNCRKPVRNGYSGAEREISRRFFSISRSVLLSNEEVASSNT